MQATRACRGISDMRSCNSTSSRRGGIGKRSSSATYCCPALWQRTRRCGADPWYRPSVTPEYCGWSSEPWPFDEQQLSPTPVSLDTSRSAAPAMKSATAASTEMPQPAIAIPVWPVGTNSEATPRRSRLAVELQADRHLPDRAIRPDRQDDRRRHLEVLAGRDVQVGRRLSQVAQGDVVLSRELDELGVGGQELVQAVVDVEAVRDAGADLVEERRREPAARGRDADERGVGAEGQRILDRADDREAEPSLSPARSVSSSATTFSGAYRMTPRAVLPK